MNCCDNYCFGLFPTKMDSPQKVEISYEEVSQLQCGNAEKVGGLFNKNNNDLKAWLVLQAEVFNRMSEKEILLKTEMATVWF